ncbi:MAG TPA: CRTAC1 family protein [Candidatus Limnocylindrales bacterium]|nr:CRTAC1 family protein [Candidatus Limnocylindrales bacterium]
MSHVPRHAALAVLAICVLALAGGALAFGAGALDARRSARAPQPPTFVDEAAAAGLVHTYVGDDDVGVGGGVAVVDCDADGRPDVFLPGGVAAAGLYRNVSPIGGALRFVRLQSPVTDLTTVTGAYPVDLDGDAMPDLVVLRNGENVLLRGLGGCRFERANEVWGFDGGDAPTMAFSATWEAGSTLPTLAFGNYVDPASNDPHHLCHDNVLVRPVGLRYGNPLPLTPSWCALSMLFSDWDRSGRRDLRVSNDLHYYLPSDGEEQLWRMEPGAAPRLYTAGEGWTSVQIQGMGIASYDLTGDGYPEAFLTSQGANRLQTLTAGPGVPTYGDIGLKRGVNATRPFTGGDPLPSTAWHDEFADVNDDGLADLFIAKGNVDDQPDFATRDPSDLLLGRPDGTFVESADAAGILNFGKGRGAALVDFNLDGLLDLVEVNVDDAVRLWRNLGAGSGEASAPMGHWIELELRQGGPNAGAIGAWIEVRAGDAVMRRELVIGGGHASGHLGWVHFGLGTAEQATVRVQWPDGEWSAEEPLGADGFAIVDRTAGIQPWRPGG